MASQYVSDCVHLLVKNKLTFAFVESATAGRLASEFAMTKDTNDCFLGGIVCYHACVKQQLLKVPQALIDQFTPESAQVTEAITKSLKNYFDADVLVGVTGLAWEGGSETAQKPVGSMFFHFIIQGQSYQHQQVFTGTAENIIAQAIERVAQLIMQYLNQREAQS